MIYLRHLQRKVCGQDKESEFPFSLPVIRNLVKLSFTKPVTFFVGENGSGKSTLLEAIAAGIGSIVVGGEDLQTDPTLRHARELGSCLKFSWKPKTHRGFFLRTEDFFNFAKRVDGLRNDFDEMVGEFEKEMTGYALKLATGSVLGQRQSLIEKYGDDPHARSHGEGFLHLIGERFVPKGLYLLDEPEVPLSPQSQLTFISILMEMTKEKDAQFIIATHSPILLAFPDAQILDFDDGSITETSYDNLPHVSLTKAFLQNPERFLRHL